MEIIIKGGSKDLKERKIRTMDSDNANFAETIMSTGQLGERMEGAILITNNHSFLRNQPAVLTKSAGKANTYTGSGA